MKRSQKTKSALKRRLFIVVLIVFLTGGFVFYALPPKGFIPVIMYHYVRPDVAGEDSSLYTSAQSFDQQMRFLKTFGFRPISVRDFERLRSGEEKVKGREVVVTFDDGHETFPLYALPILERHQIPAINFLIWNHVLMGKKAGSMTLEEVLGLKSHPLVTFGSHSLTHPYLTEISPEMAKSEIEESKKEMEKALKQPVDYFCYPVGNFNEEVIQWVKEAGYRLAFTTNRKSLGGRPETRYSITRMKIGVHDNLLTFWYKISGFKRLIFGQLTPNVMNDKLNGY